MSLHPNPELVAIYWLKGVTGITASNVASTLPEPSDSFAENGFVTVQAIGGVSDQDTFMRNSIVQVDCWGYVKDSQKLPWGKVSTLAETIMVGLQDAARLVETPASFNNARVREVRVLTDPRRVPGDNAFARYSMDLQIHWTEVE